MSKKNRPKNLKKRLQKEFNTQNQPPFDMTDPITKYILRPDLDQKKVYIANMNDNFVRSTAHKVLEAEGLSDCSNEELSKWLIERDLYTEWELACYCINYFDRGSDTNDSRQ